MPALFLIAALFQPLNPSLPIFGPGPLTNLDLSCDACMTNASAHVAWGLAIPLAGHAIDGKRGALIAGFSWIGLTLVTETLFHAPKHPDPGYPSEVRTDLLTRIVPCAVVMLVELLR